MPEIPLDDSALSAIEHALGASLTDDHELVGADYSLHTLLDFWAGHDGDGTLVGYHDGIPIYDCTDSPSFSERDLVRALVAEVRSLRRKEVA